VGRVDQQFDIRKTVFKNGLVILSEKMSQVRSVSFGVFLRSGSRHESISQHGLTHFIEHALFKGTRKRSTAQIAEETDALGGYLDAFTAREITGFYNKVLDRHLSRAFELLADLMTNPFFDPKELKKERSVILEEIKMIEDTPDDLIFDIFAENFYPDHALGRPVLGTPDTLATFGHTKVKSYYDQIYFPGNFVIAAAGNLEHEHVIELAMEYFSSLKARESQLKSTTPAPASSIIMRNKLELEQSHLVIGAPCPSALSDDRYVASILSAVLGGGMSSRLFQSIREERGLVYTIFSSTNLFADCGYFTIYAGTSTERLTETIAAATSELRKIKQEPIGLEELERNKDQLKASLMLNLESTSSRMSSLAQHEMNFARYISPDEIIEQVDAVSAEDVHRLANQVFRSDALAITVLGDLDGFTLGRSELEC
jgi:predicted Zn-dependent peptidase